MVLKWYVMVCNAHFKYLQKKPTHCCEGLNLLDISTFFGCSVIVYFNLWPIKIVHKHNCRDAQQCIYAKYIDKEEKNLEIQSIFLPQHKIILNPCKSVKSVLSVAI